MPERRISPGSCRNNVRPHAAPIAPSRQMEGPIIRSIFPGLDQAFPGSCLVEPDRVVPHRIVDAEGFVRMAAFYGIVPKFMDPLPADR